MTTVGHHENEQTQYSKKLELAGFSPLYVTGRENGDEKPDAARRTQSMCGVSPSRRK